jgi:hypothetical protein
VVTHEPVRHSKVCSRKDGRSRARTCRRIYNRRNMDSDMSSTVIVKRHANIKVIDTLSSQQLLTHDQA